eukprot:TRINITY_DN3288_c0_g1_i1.p1 TRINITY_DN3288_c0_g1~~TRINITY_DN3288_c0_g1_i1.p1  ORF type:complete len:802 (-),score=212.51 TRINITY_DN3288_c0_g1_i1:64-2436(-)
MGFDDDEPPAAGGGLFRQASLGVCMPVVTPLGFAEQIVISPPSNSPSPSPSPQSIASPSSPAAADVAGVEDVKEFIPPMSPDHAAVRLSWGTAYIPRNQIKESVAVKVTSFQSGPDKVQEVREFDVELNPRDSINKLFQVVADNFDVNKEAIRLAHHGKEISRSDEQLRKSKVFMHPPFELLCVVDESPLMQSIRLVLDFEKHVLEGAFSKGYVGEKQLAWRNTVRTDQSAYNLYVYESTHLESSITFDAVLDSWRPVRNAWIYYMRCIMNFHDGLAMVALFTRYMRTDFVTKSWNEVGGASEKWYKMAFRFCLSDFYGRWTLMKYALVCMLENMRRERLRPDWGAGRFTEVVNYIIQDTSYYEVNIGSIVCEILDNLVNEPKMVEVESSSQDISEKNVAQDEMKEKKDDQPAPAEADGNPAAPQPAQVVDQPVPVPAPQPVQVQDAAQPSPQPVNVEPSPPALQPESVAQPVQVDAVAQPVAALAQQFAHVEAVDQPAAAPAEAQPVQVEAEAQFAGGGVIAQLAPVPAAQPVQIEDAAPAPQPVQVEVVVQPPPQPAQAGAISQPVSAVVPAPQPAHVEAVNQVGAIAQLVPAPSPQPVQGQGHALSEVPQHAQVEAVGQPAPPQAAAPQEAISPIIQAEAIPQDILNALGDGADEAMIRKLLEEEQAMLMALQFGDEEFMHQSESRKLEQPAPVSMAKAESSSKDSPAASPSASSPSAQSVLWAPENPEQIARIRASLVGCGSMTEVLFQSILELEALLPRSFFKDSWQDSRDRKHFLEILNYKKKQ